jgi:hypothetical protein
MFKKNLLEQLVQFVDEPAATDDVINVWIDDSIERNDKL